MKIKICNRKGQNLPSYATNGSAGLDLRSSSANGCITLKPNCHVLVKTGISIELPVGYEAQIRPRSGLALKYGITVLNAPGTIDSDYRGEIGVLLINLGKEDFCIYPGDRIAQMIISQYKKVELEEVDTLDETNRNNGGFGHSGIK